MKSLRYILIGILTAVVLGVGVFLYFRLSRPQRQIDVGRGKITNLETMAQLCVMDIYAEVPVLDTVNDKVMFAIQKQRGTISFDLENLPIDTVGDTIRITLPREIIDIYEATDKNSWQVIDTKAIGPMAMLRTDKFTLEEENVVKSHIRKKSIERLYGNGTVARARKEAAETLQSLMESLYRKPVIVKL